MKTTNWACLTEAEHQANEHARLVTDRYRAALSAVHGFCALNQGKDAPERLWKKLFAAEDALRAL